MLFLAQCANRLQTCARLQQWGPPARSPLSTQASVTHSPQLGFIAFAVKISPKSKKFEVCLKTVRLNYYVNLKELLWMLLYSSALIFM